MDYLAILSQTIADHARSQAESEWINEYNGFLKSILSAAELTKGGILEIDGRPIPIESITKALREEFLQIRSAKLISKLTNSVIETAFRKIVEDEHQHEEENRV